MFRASILLLFTMTIAGCSGVDWFPTLGPDSPTSVTVTANPASPMVNVSTTITATVTKKDGTPVADGTLVSFSTTGGASLDAFSATTSGGTGTASVHLTSSTTGTFTVMASTGTVSGNVTVTVQSNITVVPSQTIISTAAGGSSTITATVKDSTGNNAADGTVVDFTTTAGTLSATSATTVNGSAVVTLTVNSNTLTTGTVINITATERGTSNSATTTVSITQ